MEKTIGQIRRKITLKIVDNIDVNFSLMQDEEKQVFIYLEFAVCV
jgi:hypothetical protein